jgi:hypothetical protein
MKKQAQNLCLGEWIMVKNRGVRRVCTLVERDADRVWIHFKEPRHPSGVDSIGFRKKSVIECMAREYECEDYLKRERERFARSASL